MAAVLHSKAGWPCVPDPSDYTHSLGDSDSFEFPFFFFSPELRQEEEKDVLRFFLLLSLLYLSGLSVW